MAAKDLHPSSTHPPLLPTPEDEQFDRLRLLRSRRVGISTYNRLLAEHGNAQNALAALPEVARAAGVSDYRICPEGVIHAELKSGRTAGARLIWQGDPDYPAILNDLPDTPPFLWTHGDLSLLRRPMISLVGARNASSLGTRMAKTLARDLGAEGYVVVSGMARGVDAAAHLGALETGTIAVLAGGIDIYYPAENAKLAEDICANGLLVSEQPMGLQPTARHFPRRNRIISGLSRATLIVEAAARSGSLITARDALDQGREVLAVPGHPLDARAAGCNMLIRDGAALIRSAKDVIEVMQERLATPQHPETPMMPPTANRSLAETAVLHQQILDRLGPSPVAEDQLIRDLGANPADVTPHLVELELEGQIARKPGGLLARVV